jgi:hypothetical protein
MIDFAMEGLKRTGELGGAGILRCAQDDTSKLFGARQDDTRKLFGARAAGRDR